jgi:hypothetical protein
MSDIEARLRQLGDRVDAASTSPELPNLRTLKRIRARQGVVMLGSIGAGIAIVAALVLWGPSFQLSRATGTGGAGSGVNGAAPRLSPSPPTTWVVHRVGSGVTIATPKSWVLAAQDPAKPRVVNFNLGTWRFASKGPCGPKAPFDSVPQNGMFLWMFEAFQTSAAPSVFPPRRPASFRLGPLKGPFECTTVKSHLILFRQHHRSFEILLGLGARATGTLRREVIRSLNSITIAPR